jgi:hypothetical protein
MDESRCPSTDEWMKSMAHINVIYNGVLFSHIEKMEICHLQKGD